MIQIAHGINVTEIDESKKASYLHIAQPVTLKSMTIAQKMASTIIEVDLVAIKHQDEQIQVPLEFKWAPTIEKYAWEHIESLRNVLPHKPLPRLRDIILNLYNASEAEYFVYTNLDIGLYPHFYLEVAAMIERGYDAMCVNRRDLSKEYHGVLLDESTIELTFLAEGVRHPGIDCFVFRRAIIPSLHLGNVYVGYPPVGQVLMSQIMANAEKFVWIKDQALTFHLGSDRAWKNRSGPYNLENQRQAQGLYVHAFGKRTSLFRKIRSRLNSLRGTKL